MANELSLAGYGLPYWLDFDRPRFPALSSSMTADVAIVGSGIAGLKLARYLAGHQMSVVILEAQQVGSGASSRNQGTINHGPNLTYADCSRRYGRETARRFWNLGLENHRLIREQIAEFAIDCDYVQGGMTSLVRRDVPGWELREQSYRTDFEMLQADGFAVTWLDEQEAGAAGQGGHSIYSAGLRYETDGQFHSGRFVVGLAQGIARLRGVSIFEGVRVRRIVEAGRHVRLETDSHSVEAAAVFLATNALAPQFIPQLERSLRAERGQVLVTGPLTQRPCSGSFGTSLAWWRELPQADGSWRLLFGGGRTREEPDSLFPQFTADGRPNSLLESGGCSATSAHQHRLDTQLRILFPHLAEAPVSHRWGGLQSFTADDFPLIGCLDPPRKICGMVGFCGRGNCHSDVGAQFLAGRLAGVVSPVEREYGDLFDQYFRPDRSSANWGSWQSDPHNLATG